MFAPSASAQTTDGVALFVITQHIPELEWDVEGGRWTRLLLITAASRNQTSTTCVVRDSGHWTAFEIWPAHRELSKTGHKKSITGCTFSKPVTGLKPVYGLTGLPLNKPTLTECTSDNQRLRRSNNTISVAKHPTLKRQLDWGIDYLLASFLDW